MIKTAVIGLGNMGQHHAKAYSLINDASLVAVCDPNMDRFHHIIKEDHTTYYASLDDMLATESLDAVSVCVPTNQHFDVAKACMDKGIAVLVEKPIAETVAQAQALIDDAKQRQLVLTVGHIERFNPAVTAIKDCVASGRLGALKSIICKRYGPFPLQIKDADVLVDVAVHDIDIVQYLVGQKLVSSSVKTNRIHAIDRADYGHVSLVYPNDLTVEIFVSWALPYKERIIEIVGTNGVAIVDCIDQRVDVFPVNIQRSGADVSLPISTKEALPIQKKEPIVAQCQSFVEAVRDHSEPLVSPSDATDALSLALMATR